MNAKTKSAFQYGAALALLLFATFFLAWFRALDTKPVLSLEGMEFRIPEGKKAEIKGKTTVVYFWATWCSVCTTNLPLVKWYASVLKERSGFTFLSVEEGENPIALNDFIQKNRSIFPLSPGIRFFSEIGVSADILVFIFWTEMEAFVLRNPV